LLRSSWQISPLIIFTSAVLTRGKPRYWLLRSKHEEVSMDHAMDQMDQTMPRPEKIAGIVVATIVFAIVAVVTLR
jgi:hypothetical protein